MPLSGLRILVVEDEFLIALDAEHMLLAYGAASVKTCTRAQFAETLASGSFDALLVDTGPDHSHIEDDIALAEQAGVRIAFVTSDVQLVAGINGQKNILFIAKPYGDHQLEALIKVLRGGDVHQKAQEG